jgi:GTPase SAR1 family protein
MTYSSNPQLELALNYVLYTNKNIFLTGKAGTGKTTFLQRIKQETSKRIVVVAPTGVAAINAGGVTIHSFFQLPFGPFLPDNQQNVAQQRRFSGEKIRLIKSMDLLVIDEISMVRSDLLDGIDDVLRRYKNRFEPFGGVQLLMIGDLHQLPPVVKDEEWNLLRQHYDTAYFFGSKALQKTEPVSIELKHIYRQSDTFFIDLLNKVRNNNIDTQVLDALNSRYIENFEPTDEEAYITLTSHNAAAQSINAQKLTFIKEKSHHFKAEIEGDFPAFSYPTDEEIELKVGAQVMFVKNDISHNKQFYNGKIGKIVRIKAQEIIVQCPKDNFEITVLRAEWTNVKYTLNETTKEIEEQTLGVFSQYPLKLAWAITIHKSQGLTFERAVIDANSAFAHGQVYVALSRCKTFEGIVLRSKIANSSIKTDYVVKNYSENIDKNPPDENNLLTSKIAYQQSLIRELFDFKDLKRHADYAMRQLLENETIINASVINVLKSVTQDADNEVISIADKFRPQIEYYFNQMALPENNEELQARIQKASLYFQGKLKGQLLKNLQGITIICDNKSVKKVITESLLTLEKELFTKNFCFTACEKAFSPVAYLRAKANAELDFKAVLKTPVAPDKSSISKDVDHPNLYFALKQWRDNTAANLGAEEYMILPSKALIALSNELPTTTPALKRVKGIGEAKIKQFGAEIINIIENYCAEQHIIKPFIAELELPKVEKAPKIDTKRVSYDLFKSGKTMSEIALERGFVVSTIEGHLGHFVGTGDLEITALMSEEKIKEIATFYKDNDTRAKLAAKTHFGEKYSYPELQMVVAHLEFLEKEMGS